MCLEKNSLNYLYQCQHFENYSTEHLVGIAFHSEPNATVEERCLHSLFEAKFEHIAGNFCVFGAVVLH